jgi:hypothetical protein
MGRGGVGVSEYETSGGWERRTVPVDKEAEQRELGAAGWERLERQGKVIWRNPQSGYLYPQGAAMALLRRQRENEGGDGGSEK